MESNQTSKKPFFKSLTGQILIAMLLGAVLGVVIHNSASTETAQEFSNKIKI